MQRTGILLAAAIGLALAILAGMIFIYQQVRTTPAPPLSYDHAVYVPERADLCPGESLIYTNTLVITRPAIIVSSLSWFHGRGAQARPVTTVAETPLPARVFTVPVTIGPNRRENRIPAGLPAGDYELHFGASDAISAPAVHTVPFRIRAGC